MKYYLLINIFILLSLFAVDISGQELKITEFRSDLKDISSRQNKVYDANGDACAVIKMRTGLQNVQVSSDLGIRKIEIHDGEYWLWVSPNTQQIGIEAEGFGNIQYKLPQVAEEFGVYIILLTATLPDLKVIKKVNTYVVQSKPSKAEVYINNYFFGKTPAVINIPTDTIKYSVRKKNYLQSTGEFVYDELNNWFSIKLKKNPAENMMYFIPYISGGNTYSTPIFGIETGKIGKTGWYISFVPPYRFKKSIAINYASRNSTSILLVEKAQFSSVVGDSPDKYYVKLKDKNNTFYNNFRLKFGITQKVFNNAYIKAGVGFASVRQYYRLNVIPYSNDPLLEIPLKKTYYGKIENNSASIAFETGFAYCVKDKYLLSLNIASTGFSYVKFNGNRFIDAFLPLEASLGLGLRY